MSLLVKICGLKTPDALDAALDAGADMVGFVFFPPSPRHLGYEAARLLGERVKGRAMKVALSVDATDIELGNFIEALKPDMLQLHGKEMPERVAMLRSRFGLPVMKAMPVAQKSDLSPMREYAHVADRILFDARAPQDATRPGGLGKPFDWRLLEEPRHRRAVHAVGRARRQQCRRGAGGHARAVGRRVVGRRGAARREGLGQDQGVRPRRARGGGQARCAAGARSA